MLSWFCGLFACQSSTPSATTNATTTPAVQPSILKTSQYTAPRAEKKPKELVSANGDKRIDEYYWLQERDNPAVTAYWRPKTVTPTPC